MALLANLHVKNLALIDEADVDFSEKLNILTGETGAGKSILIGSINIALGGKFSQDSIRKGAEYALVKLTFHIEEKSTLERLKAMDIPLEEDGLVIISRRLKGNRAVSKVNGETVTSSFLKELAGVLIDIHGQHEHQSLLYKSKHLDILDRYGKERTAALKQQIKVLYEEYVRLLGELNQNLIPEEERLRELSFMEYEKKELEEAQLREGEEEELEQEFRRLSNGEAIMEGMAAVYRLTGEGTESAADSLGRAVRQINRLTELEDGIGDFASRLTELEELLNDFNRDIAAYMEDFTFDEELLHTTEERLNLVHGLMAKYGGSYEQVQDYYKKLLHKLERYADYEKYKVELEKRKAETEGQLLKLCGQLSELRKENAAILKEAIRKALEELNFLQVEFDIEFRRLGQPGANGFDEVEFMISTNPGEDLKSLARVASGGELSRIMLAIKSVLADKDSVDTLIFDEIDTGISGRTAQKVSEKLSAISKSHQVISITHLPQIASMADDHYLIEKYSESAVTQTRIHCLTEEESVMELARMLGGARITDAVIHSAKEMKELASGLK
ncbi:MAG: DNA repair protein RecN [Acetivibrio ethanolgignens]